MPTTTDQAFDETDTSLELDPSERAAAEVLHNEITEEARAAGVATGGFLQGSFARKTMIKPLHDVDKVLILPESFRGQDPGFVMGMIESALRSVYPTAVFSRCRHAVKIDFGPNKFSFDAVPAFETLDDSDDVEIANIDTGGWDRSNTRTLIRVVRERNAATDGRFIRQVRMVKHIMSQHLDGAVPGLHSESWAYMAVSVPLSHDEAVCRTIETAAAVIGGTYYDPTGVDDLSRKLDPGVVAQVRPVLEALAHKAREARNLTNAGDHNEAIRLWHSIFGDPFPEAKPQDERSAISSLFAGGSPTSAGTVTTAAGVGSARPTRSWRTS